MEGTVLSVPCGLRLSRFDWAVCAAIIKEEREIVLAAVSSSGAALQFAAADLKADREVVLAVVSKCCFGTRSRFS